MPSIQENMLRLRMGKRIRPFLKSSSFNQNNWFPLNENVCSSYDVVFADP